MLFGLQSTGDLIVQEDKDFLGETSLDHRHPTQVPTFRYLLCQQSVKNLCEDGGFVVKIDKAFPLGADLEFAYRSLR